MNECEDCDRLDCRDRGCIASTQSPGYTIRPRETTTRSRDLDCHGGPWKLEDLPELKNGGQLNVTCYYPDEFYIFLTWEEPETDEEYAARMIKLDKAESRKKQAAIKNKIKNAEKKALKQLVDQAKSKLNKDELDALIKSLKN